MSWVIKAKMSVSVFAAAVLLAQAGCRNHMEYIEEVRNEERRTGGDVSYVVKASETVPNSASVMFNVEKQISSETNVFQIKTTYDRFTPYNGWLELYEVPTGLVLLPVSLTTHVFCVCTFGMFPFRWAAGLTNFSFACMNPALNAEWDKRAVQELYDVSEELVSTSGSTYNVPGAGVSLVIKSPASAWQVTADENGNAEFHFLDVYGAGRIITDQDRELEVFVEGVNIPAAKLTISRDLLQRLDRASGYLDEYRKSPGGKELAVCISKIESVGLVRLGYRLEQIELKKHESNPEFIKAFNDAGK